MTEKLERSIKNLLSNFHTIPSERVIVLDNLAHLIKSNIDSDHALNLLFVCTHNSRRSHFAQLWTQIAINHYQINGINTYSAGTSSTIVYKNTLLALINDGFIAQNKNFDNNNVIELSDGDTNYMLYSKVIGELKINLPRTIAIMTCHDADENCPVLPNVISRVSLNYSDPKAMDHLPNAVEFYFNKSKEIGTEAFYLVSKLL